MNAANRLKLYLNVVFVSGAKAPSAEDLRKMIEDLVFSECKDLADHYVNTLEAMGSSSAMELADKFRQHFKRDWGLM